MLRDEEGRRGASTTMVRASDGLFVRPRVEYLLPEAWAAAAKVLLGDADVDHVRDALRKLRDARRPSIPSSTGSRVAQEGDEASVAVRRAVEAVVESFASHLREAEASLEAHVSGLAQTVEGLLRRHGEVGEGTGGAEGGVESAISALRSRPLPATSRPEAVRAACSDLHTAYQRAYPSLSARDRREIRAALDEGMGRIEDCVARRAEASICRVVRRAQ